MYAERGSRLSTPELVGCRRTDCDDTDAARAKRSDQAGLSTAGFAAITHTPKAAMNEQGISEICFEEACTIHPDQTAKSLFSRLAHGCAYADQLLDGLATGYLVALVESVCIREMLRHMDTTTEIIVGRAINIQHCAPVAPGKRVWLRGWTSRLGERSTTFTVQVFDDHEAICDGSVTLMATSRTALEARLARKA
ncbi:MAG: hotdog domain-containing protein [Rubrivivax sp.]|nr:hotdog domain-containing protein [Rubrivivax sp.]